ncbi:MobF family relaxase [Myceligenerans pegani]|uniref:Relaxase domain-containing protein n=1 Tax=Myceligenerans pegani TaxID=2776917 RepID=A0ABR9MSY2_9MICO|nr:MobF family relaxase [Myceligenerans sp. TRM 65318]MBE1874487.1 relaxase domain-containing protein [Myceligenerans sp. TRM 65318]MBE3016758.1 relaxase domain-containing protein [Myceligenerans sp. TRM 65318]
MTVSMKKMSAGDGYRYFMESVAVGDGDRSMATPLTRYYAETGTPPGRWLGSGVKDLGSDKAGRLAVGDIVTEAQMARLAGKGIDPITGGKLGRSYPDYEPGSNRTAVAGYDFTFSLPKSASALWAVADADLQEAIVEAHHGAVGDVFAVMERELAATRVGAAVAGNAVRAAGEGGAVAQVPVTGLIAMAFDHPDSRANDPHLHTHVVVSNKVKTVLDGRWRSLDGRPLHDATVALSELHEAIVADRLTRALGVEWEPRSRGTDRNPAWAIAGVPEELVEAFSSRSAQIDARTDELIAEHRATHGRAPTSKRIVKYRAQATLETRPEKVQRSLADLTGAWRNRAARILGRSPADWARQVASGGRVRLLRADDVPQDVINDVAATVLIAVGDKKSTWRRWNLVAEVARQTKAWRFASTADRVTVTMAVTDQALEGSVRLTPLDFEATPAAFLRADGTSIFRAKDSAVFTSQALLDAEERLVKCADTRTAPTLDLAAVDHAIVKRGGRSRDGRPVRSVSVEQAEAVARIAGSGRQVDLLVGPAGAGKTTTMCALRAAWEHQHGRGSVAGLAPSATAAEVLAGDLGIGCENTAKWLYEHFNGRARFREGQLVIVDEATLAGTFSLDRITAHAAAAGAKVLLVGDPAQLQAVQAGGAFSLLAAERATRDGVPKLTEVHRFTNDWEKRASLALRHGRIEAVGAYLAHDRVRDGETDQMIECAYDAWRGDLAQGKASVLVATDTETVRALNERARAERLHIGATDAGRAVRLADGLDASAGDVVITRRNDRRLRTRSGDWVRNGSRWTVAKVRDDGSVVVRQPGAKYGRTVVLPADYAAEHLDLGYAITTHRTQGVTVATAHLLAAPGMTREHLYVGLTRGRENNTVYLATDTGADITPDDYEEPTARAILTAILHTSGAEKAATQTRRDEHERYGTIARLAAEYETLAAAAQRDRWTRLLHNSGLTPDEVDQVVTAPAFGALTAELRRAEADGYTVEAVLPALVAQRSLDDAEDPAAVLHHRLAHATARPRRSDGLTPRLTPQPRRIAGLIPQATGPMPAEYEQALQQRERRIEQRADELVARAQRDDEPWFTQLGPEPADQRGRHAWRTAARTVAAYRDRYNIMSEASLGVESVATGIQAVDARRATAALHTTEPPWSAPPAHWHGGSGPEADYGVDL